MVQKSRVAIGMITIYLILGLFYETTCRAQSKSERIRQMRSQSYAEDISRTETHISYLEQLQKDIGQVVKQIETISPGASFIAQAQSTEVILSNLLTALKNHNRTKQNISEHLVPIPDAPSGGYEGMSRSERVRRVRTDYCTDNQQNGESIRQEIPALKAAMKKMLSVNPSDELLNEPINQLQNQWAQIIPIVDDQYDEQMLAKELCTAIEQRVSKSELIRINRQGLKSGKPAPIFLNLITIN
mgnify:FL=1